MIGSSLIMWFVAGVGSGHVGVAPPGLHLNPFGTASAQLKLLFGSLFAAMIMLAELAAQGCGGWVSASHQPVTNHPTNQPASRQPTTSQPPTKKPAASQPANQPTTPRPPTDHSSGGLVIELSLYIGLMAMHMSDKTNTKAYT